MTNANPYLAPEASLTVEADASVIELATRWQRFWAAILDAIIGAVCILPLMFAFGFFSYAMSGGEPPFLIMVGFTALSFGVFALVHGYFLKRDGQTIGKKALGIKIVDLDNQVAPLQRVLLLRYLPLYAVGLIPILGQFLPLIDVLFIFGEDRRCVHDMIAGTKVIKA